MTDPTSSTLNSKQSAWLADTFARNAALFAGWRMEDAGGAGGDAGAGGAGTGSDTGAGGSAGAGADTGGGADTPPWGDSANFTPELAWKKIQELKADKAAKGTSNAALEQQIRDLKSGQQSQLDDLAKLLGFKEETPNPEQLATQITAEQTKTADAETGRLTAERKLAVFMAAAAPEVGGNPLNLLDSTSFMTSIKDIDPTDADKVTEAVKKAIDANPAFKAAPLTPSFNGGARHTPAPESAGTLGSAIASKIAAQTR